MTASLLEQRTASFSPCRRWRYALGDTWDGSLPTLTMLCLNPSVANEERSDPTVTRQCERARRLGCGSFVMLNAYGLVSTDPRGLWASEDPVGPKNDVYIRMTLLRTRRLIVGWGKHARPDRVAQLRWLIEDCGVEPAALKVNKDGSPQHPLYIGYDVQPQPYRWTA